MDSEVQAIAGGLVSDGASGWAGRGNMSCQHVTPRLGRGAATAQTDVSQWETPGRAGSSRRAVAWTNLAVHASNALEEKTRF